MDLNFRSFGFWIAFVVFVLAIVMCANTWNPVVAMIGAVAFSRMMP